MNWEKHFFHWKKWNEPIRNSAHTTERLAKRPSKYIFLAYVHKSNSISEIKRLKC